MKYCKLILIAGLSMLFCPALIASVEDELRVEGISYEVGNPQASVAIVNGEILKVGDTYQNYKVLEISPEVVRVSDQTTGAEHSIAPQPKPEAVVEEVKPSSPKVKETEPPNPMVDFFAMLGKAKYLTVIMDLKKIHMAAMIYSNDQDPAGITFKKLVELDFLPHSLEDGIKGSYQYSIQFAGNGLEVRADPIDADSKLKHFLIDDHGELYAENGKPATVHSAEYEI